MNSLHLEHVIEQNISTKSKFGGIFTVKTLPMVYNSNKFFIVNTTNDVNVMGHWVLYIIYKGELFFIDSLAKRPHYYKGKIQTFYEKYLHKKCVLINRPLQSSTSLVCGAYVYYFAYKICNQKNPRKILLDFSYNTTRNDRKVEKFLYKQNRSVYSCHNFTCPKKLFYKKCIKKCKCR